MARLVYVVVLYVGLTAVRTGTDVLPSNSRRPWILSNNGHQYGEPSDGDSLLAWTAVTASTAWVTGQEAQQLQTTSEPNLQKEHDDVEVSTVWKGLVLVAVLLVCAMAALSLVYYLCVWRGGRIYYHPQHDLSTVV